MSPSEAAVSNLNAQIELQGSVSLKPEPCIKPACVPPREAGFKPTWLGECWLRGLACTDRPTLLAPAKDALAITPQAPAAHIFLSRLAAICDRTATVKCQFGYTRSGP
jgi:hypothetical protein